ncbi:cytochrome P450 [Rhabdothermincola salaria]|uniref:cytochrome P450 n=1 Tax=Rhabdothermincola salaria TaxID=2903142 RepID=UPI001E3C453A|nr:cytochrome P450 [Rhabdothermincola salaria]
MERLKIDLLAPELYAGDPYPTYAWMRANEPVYWDDVNELWGIARYDDIVAIERNKAVFINSDQEKGGYRPNLPADGAIIGLDDPMHLKRRNLVSRRFTPRAAANWEDDIRGKVTRLLDAVEAKGGSAEIVNELAAPLPAMMIGKLLGFDEEQWPELKHWSETTIAMGGGPRYFSEVGMTSAMEFAGATAELYEAKKSCPADDVLSHYTTAEIDGCPMSLEDAIADSLLLLDGGAETTRTVIARTILNLIEHPEELAKLRDGADLTIAVEEFIRYVTPVHNMCRVATEDTVVNGVTIPKGNQVVLMYSSGNRDEDHFDDPERLDVTRHPNNHIAFGFGTHFCMGASLARLEIKVFFEELLRRTSGWQLAPGTAPVDMPNAFVHGLESAQVEFEFRS